jgi:hypothetical protein
VMHVSCSEDEEDGGRDFGECAMARAEGLMDRLVLPALWGDLARPPALQ